MYRNLGIIIIILLCVYLYLSVLFLFHHKRGTFDKTMENKASQDKIYELIFRKETTSHQITTLIMTTNGVDVKELEFSKEFVNSYEILKDIIPG